MAGWSAGVITTLGAAANSDAAAAHGQLADASRAFHRFVANDDELAALDADYYERSGTAFSSLLRTVQTSQTYAGPESTDPEAMARISVPVLLLRGQQTRRATFDTEQYAAEALVSYFRVGRKPA